MNFVYAGVDSNVIGAMAAIEAAGRTDISVAGNGGEDNVLPYLYKPLTPEKGGLAFEIGYGASPVELGFRELTGAVQLMMDKENADYNIIDLGFAPLYRNNVQAYVDSKNEWLKRLGCHC